MAILLKNQGSPRSVTINRLRGWGLLSLQSMMGTPSCAGLVWVTTALWHHMYSSHIMARRRHFKYSSVSSSSCIFPPDFWDVLYTFEGVIWIGVLLRAEYSAITLAQHFACFGVSELTAVLRESTKLSSGHLMTKRSVRKKITIILPSLLAELSNVYVSVDTDSNSSTLPSRDC